MSMSYDKLTPLHLLEVIRSWKNREAGYARSLRLSVPEQAPAVEEWLASWERVFGQTEQAAVRLIERELAPRSRGAAGPPPGPEHPIAGLLAVSLAQSREFVSQLERFTAERAEPDSRAFPPAPGSAAALLAQAANESTSYADALEPYLSEYEATSALTSSGDLPGAESELRRDEAGDATATGEGQWSRPPVPDQAPVPIGGHTLPPLPYAYDALEPYIDAKTMQLHHDIHHKSYVDGLNKAELEMQKARKTGDFSLIKHWEREAAFNGAGHYLHTLFWNIMTPKGGGKPSGALAAQIDRDFGSFEAFKKHFSQAAEKVEGGGWAILVWSPRSHRLEILQAEKHQNLSQWDVIPLLALDVWEHAYYLKYQNERGKYIDAWWNLVNWPHVNERFATARQVKWYPY